MNVPRLASPMGLMRVSVGVEDVADLIADFEQALSLPVSSE